MGRPSSFTQEIADAICERIADGDSLRVICDDEAMPARGTVRMWRRTNADFQTQYALAREDQGDEMDDEILTVARASKPDTAAADRVRIDALKWRAAHLRPKTYGSKIDVTSGGEPLPAQDDTAAAARLAALLAAADARREMTNAD